VTGAWVLAMLEYEEAPDEVTLPVPDARGLASAKFVVPPASRGSRVDAQVHVLIGETFLTIETAYFQWW